MKRASVAWALLLVLLPAPAAAQPQRVDTPGTYVHEAAGAVFPERIGEFQRTSVVRYDDTGANISSSYSLRRPDGRLHLTVYVYPSPQGPTAETRAATCRREFEASREIIVSQNKGAERVEDGAAPAAQGTSGHRSVYRYAMNYDGQDQQVRSEIDLYCHVGGQWQVKYRATFPAGYDAKEDIETFIRTGPWPGRSADPDTIASIAAPLPGAGSAP
jgi:hypothetical protein